MKHYELLYMIPVKFAGDEMEKIQNKVKEIIIKDGGEIDHEENLGKKKLAYKIKHNTQCFYIINEFDMDPANLKTLNNKLRLISEVLRHLIVSKEKTTEEERAKIATLKEKRSKKDEGSSMAGQFNIENQLSDKKEEKKEKVDTKREEVTEVKKEESVKEEKKDKAVKEEKKEEEKKEEEKKEEKTDDKARLEDLDKKLDEIIDSDLF